MNANRILPQEAVRSGMEFACEFVSFHELSNPEKLLVAFSGEGFTFIHYDGLLKINKDLPKLQTLARAAEAMWQIDRLPDGAQLEAHDRAWKEVARIAGERAATRLHAEWIRVRRKRLEAENRAAAKAWLESNDIVDYLDRVCDTTGDYDSGFVDALWVESHNGNALFAYGYQKGLEAAARAAAV